MPERNDDWLKDYVPVPARVAALYEAFGQARIETTYELTTEPDDRPKVICRAMVYRSPEDTHPSTGTSWMYLPGSTNFTRNSEIENAETSAVGRAIGFLGILIDKSIASANEIAGKQDDAPPARTATIPARRPSHEGTADGGLIGTAQEGAAPADYQLREEPEGDALSFKLMDGRKGFRVVARDDLAVALFAARSHVIGQRVTCWGVMGTEPFTKDGKTITYNVLELTRIQTPTLTLPTPEGLAPEAAGPTGEQEAPQTPASGRCNHLGSLGTVCSLDAGHEGKHRELATDGRTLASW